MQTVQQKEVAGVREGMITTSPTYSDFFEMLLEVANTTGTAFVIVDSKSKHPLYVNDNFLKICGYSSVEVLGMTSIESMLSENDIDVLDKGLRKHLSVSGKVNKFVASIKTKDGQTKRLEFMTKHFTGSNNDRIAIVVHDSAIMRNAPHDEAASDLTREAYDHGSRFDSNVDDEKDRAILGLDEVGKIKTWDKRAQQLVGYRSAEVVGLEFASLLANSPGIRERVTLFLSGLTETNEIEFESWCSRKNQKNFWASVTLTALRNVQGFVSGYSVVLRDLAKQKTAGDSSRENETRLHSLASYLQSAREEERTHLARVLHDEFGQMLGELRVDLSSLGKMVSRTVTEPLNRMSLLEKISSVSEILEKTIRSTRKIIIELRPAVLDELGLPAAIQWQAVEFENRTGIHCHIKKLELDKVLDANIATATFRILQEALDNVEKHSAATRVTISFGMVEPNLVLEVLDNGKGIDPHKLEDPGSTGIIGIRERVIALGGQLEVHGQAGKGTRLSVSIPYPKNRTA